MKNKIKNHVHHLFENSPRTKKTKDIEEEMIINLEDKYDDLLHEGLPEKEAYQSVIASIGDIEELLSSLKENIVYDMQNIKNRKRRALIISTSVMLYILSIIPIVVVEVLGVTEELALIPMFIMIAIATALLIYNNIAHPIYPEEKMVKKFKNDYVDSIVKSTVKPPRKNRQIIGIRIFIAFFFIFLISLVSSTTKITYMDISGLIMLLSVFVLDRIVVVIYKLSTREGGTPDGK